MEQAVEYVLEQLAIAFERGGELVGIRLITCHVLLREIEDAGDILHLGFRHLERLFDGVHIVLGHEAISLGHLGAKRNHAHGECDLISSRPILFLIPIDSIVSRHAAEQRAIGPPTARPVAAFFFPNRHHPFPKWTVATAYDHSLRRTRERRPTFLRLTRLFESLGIGSYHSRN